MLRAKGVILGNQRWVIGDGRQVQALDDEWVPGVGRLRHHLLEPNQASGSTMPLLRVVDLTIPTPTGLVWNEPKLRNTWPD